VIVRVVALPRLGEKARILLAAMLPIPLILGIALTFTHLEIHIFYGDISSALSLLGGIVQGLSTIVAIVFSIIIVVVQTTLGKQVTKSIRYIVTDWMNILVLCMYLYTVICALTTMWIVDYEAWTLWVDTTVVASLFSISILLPFFLRLPNALNPTRIMSLIRDEVLDAHDQRDSKKVEERMDILFSIINRSVEAGDVAYAFEGLQLAEDLVTHETGLISFFFAIQPLLDGTALLNIEKRPSVTLRVFDIYAQVIEKTKDDPDHFTVIGKEIAKSLVNICRETPIASSARLLISRAYRIILDVYKIFVLVDYFVSFNETFLDLKLREILRLFKKVGLFNQFTSNLPFDRTCDDIIQLVRKGKSDQALHMLTTIIGEIPSSPSPYIQLLAIEILRESKYWGFDDFGLQSSKVLKKLAPIKVEVISDPNFEFNEITVDIDLDGFIKIKTEIGKLQEAYLWAQHEMS